LLAIRDPIHGFIRANPLEAALLQSQPMQRLRFIHQLGWTFLVFPGAEHSRFSHALGVMHLAGRIYDALASRSNGLLPEGPACFERRLVRVAALVHDIGHAPFSHSAEGLFRGGIDHEDMTRRLLESAEMRQVFLEHGDGIDPAAVQSVLSKTGAGPLHILSEIVSSELDVDKMDYLRRDSLYCGVLYGSYDLERLIETVILVEDPEDGKWRVGVDFRGVHALEALVMARYYMFTQVYFNETSKVMELHFNKWLKQAGTFWPDVAEEFLEHDDVTVLQAMRRSSDRHARALVHRERFALAYETKEHLGREERERFRALLPEIEARFGEEILVDNSAKDPHRFGKNKVWVRQDDGVLLPMTKASDFIAQLSRIDCFRVYSARERRDEVRETVKRLWENEVNP
jgi:uncharacterized protein